MTDRELRKMSRVQLLELLIEKTRELEQVKEQLEQALEQLNDRGVVVEKAGTMAEAALQVNRVFEAADRAAQQYLDHMQQRVREQEALCAQIENESRDRAEQMLVETEVKCRRMERDAQLRCSKMMRAAEQDAGRNLEEVLSRLDRLSEENGELRQMLESGEKKRKRNL